MLACKLFTKLIDHEANAQSGMCLVLVKSCFIYCSLVADFIGNGLPAVFVHQMTVSDKYIKNVNGDLCLNIDWSQSVAN